MACQGEVSIFTGAEPEGVDIRKTGDVITLDYDEIQYLNQPFGTRSESVTPFLLNFWQGFVKLTPDSTWILLDLKITSLKPRVILKV